MAAKIAIIGGGATGCFCATEAAKFLPDAEISVFEAAKRPMSKLSITGGGRCNLTNSFEHIRSLEEAYPRGSRLMKRLFNEFGPEDTFRWWESNGVRLVTQEDGCVFPKSQNAMEIVDFLESRMSESGVSVLCSKRCTTVSGEGPYTISFSDGTHAVADAVVFTIGGCEASSLRKILPDDLEITDTTPSLFTFRIDDSGLRSLAGTVVENTVVGLAGSTFKANGPLLVTDWGVSGPAVLKLSSYASRALAESGYKATLVVNWLASSEDLSRAKIISLFQDNPRKNLSSVHPEAISGRLWDYLVAKTGMNPGTKCQELGPRNLNRLINVLTADCLQIVGRCRFKSEFVTCGGVSLKEIEPSTLESRKHKGLYFGGEALDLDAITGGFNLQAAWTCGHTIARALQRQLNVLL